MHKFYEHVAAAAVLFMLSGGVANAAPLTFPFAEGSFGFVPNEPVLSSNNNLNPGTAWTEYPNDARVNIASTGNLNILVGASVETERFSYAPGLGTAPADLDITVNGLVFHFEEVTMLTHAVGAITARWEGFLANGAGIFAEGSEAFLTQSCDQIRPSSVINCSNTTLVAEAPTQIPEPTPLALLGAALLSFGLIGRKKLSN